MNTVRILLSLATHYNWQLLWYDVKNAFLHGDLDKEIYMNIPPRFEGSTRGVTALLVYVDDIIVTGNDEREKHEVKDLHPQQKYVTDILAETGKIECKSISTTMDSNHKLGEVKEEPMVDKRKYQRLVGRLIYLAHTRPNIAYSMSMIQENLIFKLLIGCCIT
ncbi:Retrovirus-related Pol polyprotein from transposon RE1 [Vitis vinifera]|uniref:Retrovirus-related Pol polyprotein from transposon RE1 n=1 Tax=Vitis vinifera TaxID=29760 RepID=A0A438K838_VITVI|nr:Retrovirus-related Pol polyprotein from transposon RE1 [Vitis vinifera]